MKLPNFLLDELVALEESLTNMENITISLTPIKQGHITLLTYIDSEKISGPPIIITVEDFPDIKMVVPPKQSVVPGTYLKFTLGITLHCFIFRIIIKYFRV